MFNSHVFTPEHTSAIPLLNSELKKLAANKGVILIANVKTSQIIGFSSLNKATKPDTIGSLAKLISATALLEENIINNNTKFNCTGHKRYGNEEITCWNPSGHGNLTLQSAIAHSCNLFFYNYLQKLDASDILKYYKSYHLNNAEIHNEFNYKALSSIPESGLNVDLGLGTSKNLQFTPLQILAFATTLANNGIYKPLWITKQENNTIRVSLQPSTPKIIKDGMIASGKYGTSKLFSRNGFSVAAKTGTAPNHSNNTHGWCIGFAPIDNPKISFCTFIDKGTGFSDAVPLTLKALKVCKKLQYI